MPILTMSEVNIDTRLTEGSVHLGDLALCRVFLVDNALFPWLVLVPKKPNLVELLDLSASDRYILMDEIALVSRCFKEIFSPDKLNVATLGNQVSQLHIHVIARFKTDSAWPEPVWGKGKIPYGVKDCEEYTRQLRQALSFSDK